MILDKTSLCQYEQPIYDNGKLLKDMKILKRIYKMCLMLI